MKIKFKVHHTYGLAHEEVFKAEDLGLDWVLPENWNKDNEQLSEFIKPILIEWTAKKYNHGDALPSWEIVK